MPGALRGVGPDVVDHLVDHRLQERMAGLENSNHCLNSPPAHRASSIEAYALELLPNLRCEDEAELRSRSSSGALMCALDVQVDLPS